MRLWAAGSLKAALSELAVIYEQRSPGITIACEFGASGLLRERIEAGEEAHVFASADLGHPTQLVEHGLAEGEVQTFAHNVLCLLCRPDIAARGGDVLTLMLDPRIRLGISTPGGDPAGDYALKLFTRAGSLVPGAEAVLTRKALRLTGAAHTPKGPGGRNTYAHLLETGAADLFLTYRSNALPTRRELPDLCVLDIPDPLAIGADYGLVLLKGAPPAASGLFEFIRSGAGQDVLERHGFLRAG